MCSIAQLAEHRLTDFVPCRPDDAASEQGRPVEARPTHQASYGLTRPPPPAAALVGERRSAGSFFLGFVEPSVPLAQEAREERFPRAL
jgi:hypothetical protein